ncbi:serpin family protein [Mucilaginibacter sp. 14171R-50]|uniref:serpin family protein n=1 Tax=Mucilaginibacter sp. 14171R-50 TaxID=2703789 RepID=UPI00138CCF75|nr:serpin family protein [Mucilaginibacter sp. 14171R-50]QHS55705.1 serpin family protein [Mucilaginibacter sp. 14171R-50]
MTRKTPLLFLSLLAIGFVSCKKSDNNPDKGKALELTAAEHLKVAADNAFTLKLVKQLNSGGTGNDNVFVSPLSVSFAMGMTSNGAKGETLQGINNAMEFSGFTQEAINTYYNKLIDQLPNLEPNTQVNIANSIWYKQGFDVLPSFITTNTNAYKAKVQALDFGSAAAKNQINEWVSDQTKGKIPSIIDNIPGDVRMYLINAIYFKSIWKNKFNPADTKKMPFKTSTGSTVQADFMTGQIEYGSYFDNYDGDKYTQIAELPYANGRYSMVVVLPDESSSVNELISNLDTVKWNKWMKPMGGGVKNHVYFPKLKFTYNTTLNGALIALGMGKAFSDDADLTGISAAGGINITEVKQKAFVEVNEQGTEAAAATSVAVGVTAAPATDLNLNRPFVFAIRENSSGLVLFAGVVNNPLLTGN